MTLGGCVISKPSVPPIPSDLEACMAAAFPEIPATSFGRKKAIEIIGTAKLLDRAKTLCGERAISWMKRVSGVQS